MDAREQKGELLQKKNPKPVLSPSLLVDFPCALHIAYKLSMKYYVAAVIYGSASLCMHFEAVF